MVAHVVVVAQAGVAGQAGGGGLPAAVHRHQVDVDVDQQVGLGRPPVHLHDLAVGGGAQDHHPVGVLGVVVVEAPRGGEGVVDPVADGVAQLGLGHAPVQGQGGDQLHVVDPGGGGLVEHGLDDPLADVGAGHGRQRQRDVVEGDRQLHAREQPGAAAGRSRGGARARGGWRASGSAHARRAARGGRSPGSGPAGSFSSRKPSPWWKRMGGVEESTSSTKPGRGATASPRVGTASAQRAAGASGRRGGGRRAPARSARPASPACGPARRGGSRGSRPRGIRPLRAAEGHSWSRRRPRPRPDRSRGRRRSRTAPGPGSRRWAGRPAARRCSVPSASTDISATTTSSNSGRSGSMTKSRAPVISTRAVAGPAVLPHPAQPGGEGPGEHVGAGVLVGVVAQLADRGRPRSAGRSSAGSPTGPACPARPAGAPRPSVRSTRRARSAPSSRREASQA